MNKLENAFEKVKFFGQADYMEDLIDKGIITDEDWDNLVDLIGTNNWCNFTFYTLYEHREAYNGDERACRRAVEDEPDEDKETIYKALLAGKVPNIVGWKLVSYKGYDIVIAYQ